jgi:hypothetical protein
MVDGRPTADHVLVGSGWPAGGPSGARLGQSGAFPDNAAARKDALRVTQSLEPSVTLDAVDALRAFSKPVLLAWGAADRLFPLEHARRLEADFADARPGRDERSQHVRDARSARRACGKDHRIRKRHHEQRIARTELAIGTTALGGASHLRRELVVEATTARFVSGRDQANALPASQADRRRASPTRSGTADDGSREDHQVPHRTVANTLGPARAATRAGIDVRAAPASNLVASERGHGSSLRGVGCSELGDRLKRTWSPSGSDHLEASRSRS